MCVSYKICKNLNLEIEVVDYRRKCTYHTRKNQTYSLKALWKGVFCIEAFHIVYPYFLASLYDAKFKSMPVILRCPGHENEVLMQLNESGIKNWETRLLNFIKKVLRPIKPTDVIDKVIKVEIIGIKGVCPAGYKKGDSFDMNERDVICPAAFDIIYPNIFRLIEKETEGKANDDFYAYCPSHKNKVKYIVRMISRS